MPRFEYDITAHSADLFQELVYFCTEQGECRADRVPHDQAKKLKEILNGQGEQGWELVNIQVNQSGILAFWKRRLAE